MRVGRYCNIRPLEAGDEPHLYALTTSPGAQVSWRFRTRQPTVREFVESLWNGVLHQVVVLEGGAVRGHVIAYNPDLTAGWCYLAVLAHDELPRGVVVEAAGMFLAELFDRWPLRKVYFEADSLNLGAIGQGVASFADEVGVFPKHVFRGGEFRDVSVYQITRERFDDQIRPLLSP